MQAEGLSKRLAVIFPEFVTDRNDHEVRTAGGPFTYDHAMKDGVLDVEAGLPAASAIEDSERIRASTLPAGPAVTAWHVGSHHELGRTYDAVEAWMKANGHVPGKVFWEVYWTAPGLEPDPSRWRTKVHWPIAAKGKAP